MKPTFTLFHGECVNACVDSLCHLVIVHVVDGEIRETEEFFVNPEAEFEVVMSGITEEEVNGFPAFKSTWKELERALRSCGYIICSADGYTARALYGTVSRFDIDFIPIEYCNAKSICRKTFNEVYYGLEYLCDKFNLHYPLETDLVEVAKTWAQLVILALDKTDIQSIPLFLTEKGIIPGFITKDSLTKSLIKKQYKNKTKIKLDIEGIQVTPQEDNPFYGQTVVFTGKLERLTRLQARTAVISIGGNSPDSLTKSTNYLVVGAQDLRVVGEKGMSGKMKKAADYKEKGEDIEIIDEEEFIDMIGEDNLK